MGLILLEGALLVLNVAINFRHPSPFGLLCVATIATFFGMAIGRKIWSPYN